MSGWWAGGRERAAGGSVDLHCSSIEDHFPKWFLLSCICSAPPAGLSFGLLWLVLGCSGVFWIVLGCSGLLWAALGCFGLLWHVLGCSEVFWIVLGCSGLSLLARAFNLFCARVPEMRSGAFRRVTQMLGIQVMMTR